MTESMITSWAEAEMAAAIHMRSLGFADAEITKRGADKGIDVLAASGSAQVKHMRKPVGSPTVQQFIGAAAPNSVALIYSLSGFTAQAVDIADDTDVALFTYTVEESYSPSNRHAQTLAEIGYVDYTLDSQTERFQKLVDGVGTYLMEAYSFAGNVASAASNSAVATLRRRLENVQNQLSAHEDGADEAGLRSEFAAIQESQRRLLYLTEVFADWDSTREFSGSLPRMMMKAIRVEQISLAVARDLQLTPGDDFELTMDDWATN
ncbi:restriction endonuclease [Microbacterium sp. ISL-103]|uniref:restriction endonuclease n=1 Tax=Microbacterium sp. ISL-103 TaxID=2819156 RepID=UPI001BEB14C4|nr:restriction endonuclease [Microbacterium sp. ISL-103]MBT2475071.1 restriction endonuclease [Microbacterium sp. ISL-103]